MQRVSAFLPSWDKRNSNSGGSTATSKSAAGGGGGFFSWPGQSGIGGKRNSGANGIAKINVNAANARNSKTGSIIHGRVRREAFWPATLDFECEKAARIIKSFCADGYLAPADEQPAPPADDDQPQPLVTVAKKIPKRVIQNAAGIAVFTCMRNGLWMTGSGGSGILIARKSDGTWSPPSGIMLHTPTLSFIIGVDIYDCVLVINSLAALEAITSPTVTLGDEVDLTTGPLVAMDQPGSNDDFDLRSLENTVLTYVKSRGQAQLVNLNGCILTERANENERFYEAPVTQMDVLSGNVSRHVEETGPLSEVIKLAEGRSDFDPAVVAKVAIEPAPGDANIASPTSSTAPQTPRRGAFGVPQADDPDPFGLLALEMAGMEIREAGSRPRPASSQPDFQNRPASAAMSKHYRQSGETFMTRSNRESCMSSRTVKSQMTDAHTQTDAGNTPETSPSPGSSEDNHARASFPGIREVREGDEDEVDYTTVDLTPLKHLSEPRPSEDATAAATAAAAAAATAPAAAAATAEATTSTEGAAKDLAPPPVRDDEDKVSKASSHYADDGEHSDSGNEASDASDEEEEPVVFEVAEVQPARTQAVASRMIQAKGSMVTIPKRIPPPLPSRNPARGSMTSRSDASAGDASSIRSPEMNAVITAPSATDGEHDSQAPLGSPIPEMLVSETPEEVKPIEAAGTLAVDTQITEPEAAADHDEPTKSGDAETPRVAKRQSTEVEVQEAEEGASHEENISNETPAAAESINDSGPLAMPAAFPESSDEEVEKPAQAVDDDASAKRPVAEGGKDADDITTPATNSVGAEDEAGGVNEKNADSAAAKEDAPAAISEEAHIPAPASDEAVLAAVPGSEDGDGSESVKKGRLSVDTGATGTRSSLDGTSYTTPTTSERHPSFGEVDVAKMAKDSTAESEKPSAATVQEEGSVDAPREETQPSKPITA